jgi:hypothetical protein
MWGSRTRGVYGRFPVPFSDARISEETWQTANNRKSPYMLPQSLDIFKISGTVDNYCISIVPFN